MKCLSEYQTLVRDVTFNVTKVKFNREIPIEEEKIIFEDILPHANINKQYNDVIRNWEYSFGKLSIKQYEIFVKKFA